YHAWHLTKCVANAIAHKGFLVVEVLQNCHELWGRRNGMPQASQMLNWYRDDSITVAQAKEMSPEQVKGKFVIGEFVRSDRPEIGEEYAKLIARVQKKG
ncbi:MAG: 2-oxoacid:ferredoxin oxidoreductase subunit beta, partial [Chloroflexota bacterium]